MSTDPSPITPTPSTTTLLQFRRRSWIILAFVASSTLGAGIWWMNRHNNPPAPVPPMPGGIQDSEIATALEKKRAGVLANPHSGDSWGEYGMLLLAQLFAREADACFAEAARLNPQDPRWPYGRGYLALKTEPVSSSLPIDYLRQAVATSGPGEEHRTAARLLLAESLVERGDLDGAEKLFRVHLVPPPGLPRAQFGLGMLTAIRGDAATAEQCFTALLNDRHVKKMARVQLAQIARVRGDSATAARLEREAFNVTESAAWADPFNDEVIQMAVGRRGRERAAELLERQGRFEEAVQIYLEQLEIERTPKLLMGAAIILIRQRSYDRALPLFREAVGLAPNDPDAHFQYARALFIRAQRAYHEQPGLAEIPIWFRACAEHATRATELKRDHAEAYLFWGLSLKYLGDPKGAIEPLEKGLVARPEAFELHLGLGQALAAVGRTAEAAAKFKDAQKLDPDDPRPVEELKKLESKPK